MKYKIIRTYKGGSHDQTIRRGLTLEEAWDHCSSSESSSRTCTSKEAKVRTRAKGPWFDFYERDRRKS